MPRSIHPSLAALGLLMFLVITAAGCGGYSEKPIVDLPKNSGLIKPFLGYWFIGREHVYSITRHNDGFGQVRLILRPGVSAEVRNMRWEGENISFEVSFKSEKETDEIHGKRLKIVLIPDGEATLRQETIAVTPEGERKEPPIKLERMRI